MCMRDTTLREKVRFIVEDAGNQAAQSDMEDAIMLLISELDQEDELTSLLVAKLNDLLERTVNILKGPPPDLTQWSYHDIPEQVDSLKEQLKAIKETQSAEVHELKERLDVITDRLKNGIKYDEDLNLYIVVWTKREIEKAKEEAEELNKFFNFPIAP